MGHQQLTAYNEEQQLLQDTQFDDLGFFAKVSLKAITADTHYSDPFAKLPLLVIAYLNNDLDQAQQHASIIVTEMNQMNGELFSEQSLLERYQNVRDYIYMSGSLEERKSLLIYEALKYTFGE